MSIKLRDLIRNVRACKTAAEERAVIAKESALIRTAFKDQDNQYRHRNVAKLLFIHMLGYPSHFGQMECLKLIASPSFPEKRIGYLGLMLLLTDQEEVLTLVTNSLKNDLNHSNPFIVGLSLTAIGNIATADIGRDLSTDLDKLLTNNNNDYIRKKIILAVNKVLKKLPELIPDYYNNIIILLKSKNHGVLICAIQLLIDIFTADPANLELYHNNKDNSNSNLVSTLVKLLRNLLSIGYLAEYDVNGFTDPFLQVKILRLLMLLNNNCDSGSNQNQEMNDMLAQVATNTESNNKNTGNAILYECVLTILSNQNAVCDNTLKVLAINILGRFLLNRDNNIRYVALNTLSKVVSQDTMAVQRHRNTIVDCLKDPDNSIRTRALELIYALVNETNIQTLAREMLNYLVVAPNDQKALLCSRIADAVERYAPSARWHIDTKITMLSIVNNNNNNNNNSSTNNIGSNTEFIVNSLIALIQQNPNLHSYVVRKLYYALINNNNSKSKSNNYYDISQVSLIHVGVWCIGEYTTELLYPTTINNKSNNQNEEEIEEEKKLCSTKINDFEVIELLEKILKTPGILEITKCFLLTSLIKITSRITSNENLKKHIKTIIDQFKTSMILELQQRATEYSVLLDNNTIINELFLKMPVINPTIVTLKKTKRQDSMEDMDTITNHSNNNTNKQSKNDINPVHNTSQVVDLLGFDSPKKSNDNLLHTNSKKAPSLLDLDDIFGGTGPISNTNSTIPINLLSPGLPGVPMTINQNNNNSNNNTKSNKPTVDLLSDIFSAPTSTPTKLNNNIRSPTNINSMTGIPLHSNLMPLSPHSIPQISSSSSSSFTNSSNNINNNTNIMDMMNIGSLTSPTNSNIINNNNNKFIKVKGYEKDGLNLNIQLTKPNLNDLSITHILCIFNNKTLNPFNNFLFQAAFPKYINLTMDPPNGSMIPPNDTGSITQLVKIQNTLHLQKPIMMRIKLQYAVNGKIINEIGDVSTIPGDY